MPRAAELSTLVTCPQASALYTLTAPLHFNYCRRCTGQLGKNCFVTLTVIEISYLPSPDIPRAANCDMASILNNANILIGLSYS
jgi:hypothetical protein